MPDPYAPPTGQTLRWVERALGGGAKVVRICRLVGGLTAFMDRLTIGAPSGRFDVVLRRWPDGDDWWIGSVEREAAGLDLLRTYGLPTPRSIAVDSRGADAGIRCILTSALPGQPLLAPVDVDNWVSQLARMLTRIHALPPVPADEHRGWFDPTADREWLGDAGLARAAVAAASADVTSAQRTLVHGDYQHFNILWTGTRLTGVVDWPSVGSGQRGLDVGHCRLNLAVLYTAEVAEQFLRRYEATAGIRVDPRVDLRSLLCFDAGWAEFIPLQVAGRAPVDRAGMAMRVTQLVRAALARVDRR